MGLILGALSAIFFGSADFLAARAGRTDSSPSVARTTILASSLLSPLLLVLVRSQAIRKDLLVAALAGVFMSSGLVLLYEGYRRSAAGVVGPASSVATAVVPIVYDLVRGRSVGGLSAVGMALGIAALVLTSYVPSEPLSNVGSTRGAGLLLGALSGGCFGTAFILMSLASKQAGLSTVVAQRSAAFAFLMVAMPLTGGPLLVTRPPGRRFAILGGILALSGIAVLQLGFRRASVGPVSVAASQFATVTVLLAVAFNGERLRRSQALGVALAAVAVALMAVG